MSILDLDGKVVFKVKLGSEIKKTVIHNDELTFNELCLMMQRIFSEKISTNDEFTLKYTDEDNDLVTIANDNDVLLAIQTNKVLRLTIYLSNADDDNKAKDGDKEVNSTEILKELQTIRNSIDRFLGKFDSLLSSQEKQQKQQQQQQAANSKQAQNDTKSAGAIESQIKNMSVIDTHKEFDPLAKKVRSETPDSVSSMTSSPSQRRLTFNQDQQQQVQQQQPQQAPPPPQQQQYYNQSNVMSSFPMEQQQQQPTSMPSVAPAALVPPPPQQQQQMPPTMLQQPQYTQYQAYPQQAQVQAQAQVQQQAYAQQQQAQQLTPEQQQYMLQQQQYLQQQQQAQQQQQQGYQQMPPTGPSNPYAKAPTAGMLPQRYPTPANLQQAYK